MRLRRARVSAGIAVLVALVAGFVSAPATAQAAPTAARTDGGEARLQQVARVLRSASVPGTAWYRVPGSDMVEVIADRTVTGVRLERIEAAIRSYSDVVRLRRVEGAIGVRLSGGDPVSGGGARCTLGANVTDGGAYYFITSGHCGSAVSTWYTLDGALVGSTVANSFPGNDYSVVRYTGSVPHEGTVGDQDITSAGNAYVGESVCMRGAVSGVRCGTVLALNATVNYPEGTVSGLIRTNICSEPGDSGAPLYDGTRLLGILSGGSGNCTSGGTSFFQPIIEILSAYGLAVY
ncbi:hypothetical protein Arub01_35540 [Actinomadura rubrobrunea]|uniref:Peptidase S1 domain-containing protein n=1 Tax=Actinomadura rubrobrunea TaxID=115335 RepID=A0A9W6PWN0_9ACTN|nr:S1 family peptidase [Actinomadura rubrobrunea]GLW65310.1 hypothetical protein Arub01_35540 [Actinomadura rubrobrunea]